jgi:hypothetical protein
MKNITISAKSIEEFTEIQDALKELPDTVSNQIESAKKMAAWIECVFKAPANNGQDVFVPTGTTQINHFDTYIGVYCGIYFFKLPTIKSEQTNKYNFVFLDAK